MKITIEIEYVDFNGEWIADIKLNNDKTLYYATDTLPLLMQYIERELIKYYADYITNENHRAS